MTINKPYLNIFLWLILTSFSGALAVLGGLYLYLSPKLPGVETLRQIKLQTPLRIYTSDQKLIGEFGEKRRQPIAYTETPTYYIQGILAAEDDQFYAHHGVSIKGLLRAASQLLQTGHIQTGGSTITMQVARNFFLTRKQTFARKFNEILLALQIERELSKEEILELYINKIYLGNRAYGIQAAARVYYGKDINELSLAQLAMIAGLPKAPSAYNPIINPTRALIRRNWILGRMAELGDIDDVSYAKAISEPITAIYHRLNLDLDAPYIAEMARKETVEQFGEAAYTDGYRVITTIDSRLQARAQQAVTKGLLTYDQRHGYRGPEQQLIAATEDGSTEHWLPTLKTLPSYAGLRAAAVTYIGEQEIEALLGNGEFITLTWTQGLEDARPYISEDKRGPKPKIAADIFTEGDVIRVSQTEDEQWQLSQIPAAQAALVALNPDNGATLSLVGGFDFQQSHFNRATQATRQPGSNFKPFIYTTALENGFTPATLINDAPIVFDDNSLENTWRPENASGKFFGPTRLRKALYQSRNLVSIRVLRSVGISTAIKQMDRFGFNKEKLPKDLSLALGSYGLTPLKVATGYATFANGGYKIEPFLISRTEGASGEILFEHLPFTVCRNCEELDKELNEIQEQSNENSPTENSEAETENDSVTESAIAESSNLEELLEKNDDLANNADSIDTTNDETNNITAEQKPEPPRAKKVLDEQVAYLIDTMLRDVIKRGTGTRAKVLGRHDLAGKTGTTNGPKDAWFSGYNHHIVATTWLGFDQNSPLGRREYGGSAALPIWIDFMKVALDGVPEITRPQPDGLVTVRIDPKTGERAQAGNPNAIYEIFRAENVPEFVEQQNPMQSSGEMTEETLPEELF